MLVTAQALEVEEFGDGDICEQGVEGRVRW